MAHIVDGDTPQVIFTAAYDGVYVFGTKPINIGVYLRRYGTTTDLGTSFGAFGAIVLSMYAGDELRTQGTESEFDIFGARMADEFPSG